MIRSIPKKYIILSLLISGAISVVIHISLLIQFFFEAGRARHDFTLKFVVFELLATFFTGLIIFLLNYSFYKPFSLHYKLKFKNILVSLAVTFI
ncbi:MAG: hypothetical protein JW833_08845, partial [Prolixibacteraceae bacterium]|nr:hypothetical protein [Prolixibacteraceae bacterium]